MYLSATRQTTFKLDNTAAVYQMKKKTRILFNLCTQQPNIKIFSAADLQWVLSCFRYLSATCKKREQERKV